MTTTRRRTRVTQSIGDPGKWQAQYFDPSMELWCDIGDATLTHEEAKEKESRYRTPAETRRAREALELPTLDEGSIYLKQDDMDPQRLKLSVTSGANWPADDGTSVLIDTADLLQIMAWGVKFLAEQNAGRHADE